MTNPSVWRRAAFPPFVSRRFRIAVRFTPNLLKLPPAHSTLGKRPGVATDSKGDIFVYTRTGGGRGRHGGIADIPHGGSRLCRIRPQRIVPSRRSAGGIYGFLFGPRPSGWIPRTTLGGGSRDRTWSSVRFRRARGMTMGRKPEAINVGVPRAGAFFNGPRTRGRCSRRGLPGEQFPRPTDVAWDAAGNSPVSTVTAMRGSPSLDKTNGKFLKSWGSLGPGEGQFTRPHPCA